MLTGRRAFQGKSYPNLPGAILSADPAPMAVKPFTPVWLERLVRRWLAKDSEDRYYSMHDVALAIYAKSRMGTLSAADRNVLAKLAVQIKRAGKGARPIGQSQGQ